MRNIFTIISLISLFSSPSWSETLAYEDLVERGGLYYKKFTDTPFTGETSGTGNGKFIKGKKEGKWVYYHKNGQLYTKGNYKDGKREDGLQENYYENGQLKSRGAFKEGKIDGLYERYHDNGQLKNMGKFTN